MANSEKTTGRKGRPENLKPFPKGKSGNPNGRPRKLPKLEEIIANVLGEEKDGLTAAEAILSALRAKAARGDVRAAKELLDRGYGLPKQTIKHQGDPEAPVMFKLDERFLDDSGA